MPTALVARARQAHVARIATFGEKPGSDARLISYEEGAGGSHVRAEILGTPVDFRLGAPGKHIAQNAAGALLAVALLEGDVLNAAAALKGFAALKGRGARFAAGGVDVIDESYNANPASMAAALALLGAAKGRRVAVLGDMLEMGPDGAAHHAALAAPLEAARADLVFLNGSQMKALWEALPAVASRRLGVDLHRTRAATGRRASTGRHGSGQRFARQQNGRDCRRAESAGGVSVCCIISPFSPIWTSSPSSGCSAT
ncbi:MAG: cyanophycin synthetase [Rhizomicrobium sp.]